MHCSSHVLLLLAAWILPVWAATANITLYLDVLLLKPDLSAVVANLSTTQVGYETNIAIFSVMATTRTLAQGFLHNVRAGDRTLPSLPGKLMLLYNLNTNGIGESQIPVGSGSSASALITYGAAGNPSNKWYSITTIVGGFDLPTDVGLALEKTYNDIVDGTLTYDTGLNQQYGYTDDQVLPQRGYLRAYIADSNTEALESGSSTLTSGVIAGIVVAVIVVALVGSIVLGVLLWRKRKRVMRRGQRQVRHRQLEQRFMEQTPKREARPLDSDVV